MKRHSERRVPFPWKLLLLFLLAMILLGSGGLWARDVSRAYRENAAYRTLVQKVHAETSPYETLARENPDLAGWLSIEDTPVDYPVMWTPTEPEYYLRRAFDGSDAVSGSLFIGANCEPNAPHVIIYGHNMRDGSMFGSLSDYASADYAADHPVIRFNTLAQPGEYKVLAAFYSHAYTPDEEGFRYYQYTDLSQQDAFEAYVRQAKESSLYETETTAQYGDRLLTLSTCSYHQENGTFVVVASAPSGASRPAP